MSRKQTPNDRKAPHAQRPSINVGVLAIRFGKTLEWDAPAMKVKDAPEFDPWIKESVRDGWAHSEDLWKA